MAYLNKVVKNKNQNIMHSITNTDNNITIIAYYQLSQPPSKKMVIMYHDRRASQGAQW